jgi:MmyB-like transcription regulator ligand binding domain
MLVNHRLDILVWNPEMAVLMLDFDALPDHQRNALWLCLLYPPMRDFYPDHASVVRDGIADLRAAWAAHPEDTALDELINELTRDSTEFAQLWPQRCVRVNSRGLRPLLHPQAGPMTVEYEILTPLQDPDHRIIIYRAADTASQAAIDAIAREAQRSSAPNDFVGTQRRANSQTTEASSNMSLCLIRASQPPGSRPSGEDCSTTLTAVSVRPR